MWVFQKAEIAWAPSVKKNSRGKSVEKNSRGKSARRCFLKPFFSHLRKLFSESLYKTLVIAVYMKSLAYNFLNVFLQIIIQNYYVLFGLVLHFLHWCYTWTALHSANQNWVIFSCVLLLMEYLSKLQKFQFTLTSFNFAGTISAFVSKLAITWKKAWEDCTLSAMLLFSSVPPFSTGHWQNNYSKNCLLTRGIPHRQPSYKPVHCW